MKSCFSTDLEMETLSGFVLVSKVILVTGGANGIGSETVRELHGQGARIVIADLEEQRGAAEHLQKSLGASSRIIFCPVDVTDWESMKASFRAALNIFGAVHVVVTCAGIMEARAFFETMSAACTDSQTKLKPREPVEALRVIDINLRGSMIGKEFPHG